jgi:hypothetical protein
MKSDSDIERASDELKWRSDLDAGDVVISGDRLAAEMASKRVAGVKAVANDTVVRLRQSISVPIVRSQRRDSVARIRQYHRLAGISRASCPSAFSVRLR